MRMSWDESTGGGASFEREASAQISLVCESVSGDRWAPGIETPSSRSTGETKRPYLCTSETKLLDSSRRIPERAIRKRQISLKACLDELERFRNSDGDPILKGNAMTDVKKHLQSLWEQVEGNPDSEAFEEIVNMLQIALCVESADDISPRQVDAIWHVITEMYNDPDVDDQTANDLTQEIIKGGVDVFREIG